MAKAFFYVSLSCLLTFILSFISIGMVNSGLLLPMAGVFLWGINLVVVVFANVKMILRLKSLRSTLRIETLGISILLSLISLLLSIYYIDIFVIYITGNTGCALCP